MLKYNISYLPLVMIAKFPLSQLPTLCTVFVLKARNVAKLDTIPPSIIPKSGIKITSVNRMYWTNLTNKNVPPILNITANINLIIINKYISKAKYDETLLHELAHLELNHMDKVCLDFKIEGIEDEADKYVEFLLNLIKTC